MSSRHAAARHKKLVTEIRNFIANTIFFHQKVAERFNLNLTDTQCLNVLDMAGSATPGQLAERTGLTTGGVTVVLDRLEKAGFIQREPNPDDRRSLIIRPIPAAMERMHAIYADINQGLGKLLAGYDEREMEIIVDFFEKSNRMRSESGLT